MSNMNYCLFENTFRDLQDCYYSLREKDFKELSETEKKFRNYMVELCKDVASEFEVEEVK